MIKTKLFSKTVGVLVLCFVTSISFAQFGFRMNHSQLRPIGMSKAASNAYGISLGVHYRFQDTPFSIGIEGGLSMYSPTNQEVTLPQTAQVPQGTYDLNTHNLTGYYFLVPRIYLNNKGILKTYINGRIGRLYHTTSFTLHDQDPPMDPSHTEECPTEPSAVAEGSLLRNALWVVGGGIGARLDLVRDIVSINLEVNYLRGGIMRHLGPVEQVTTQSTDPQGITPQAPLLNHPYVNGQVYYSAASMLDIRFGIFFSMP
ncbi:hypothetical protein BKI52_25455 [marine bacterium AO1-C]|nr:hypothetical protein BKI52_25455 [marine bacterium AO1-C]